MKEKKEPPKKKTCKVPTNELDLNSIQVSNETKNKQDSKTIVPLIRNLLSIYAMA